MIKENLMNYLWFQRTVNYLWFQSTVKSLSFSRSLFVSVWVVTTHHLVPFLQSLMGRKPASPGYSQPVASREFSSVHTLEFDMEFPRVDRILC